MSAIYGILWFDRRPVTPDRTAAVALVARGSGPDRQDEWSSEGLILGHALRRITGEDDHDRQPLFDADAGLCLAADLRLDNREEIAEGLGLSPSRIAEMADSELLLGGVSRWGDKFWPRLIGAAACAVWDDRERRLVLARDPLGERTLYYCKGGQYFAFASDQLLLATLVGDRLHADEQALADSLFFNWYQQERTYFSEIRQIPPGATLTLTDSGRFSLRTYFDANSIREVRLGSQRAYAEALEERLLQAVRRQTRTRTGVMTHLSAGLDSSAVTVFTAGISAAQNRRHYAFTLSTPPEQLRYIPPGRFPDESVLAGRTALLYPSIRHVVEPFPDGPLFTDMEMYCNYGRKLFIPLACGHACYEAGAARAADLGVNVLLAGFSGNFGFSYDGLAGIAHHLVNGRLVAGMRLLKAGARARNQGMLRAGYRLFFSRLIRWILLRLFAPLPMGGPMVRSLVSQIPLRRDFLADRDVLRRARRDGALDFLFGGLLDARSIALRYFQSTAWYRDMMRDFKSRHGVEIRDPLSDRSLVEFCLGIPEDCYLASGRPRALARQVLQGKVPPEILECSTRGFQQAGWVGRFERGKPRMAELIRAFERSPTVGRVLDTGLLRSVCDRFTPGYNGSNDYFLLYYHLIPIAFQVGQFLLDEEESS